MATKIHSLLVKFVGFVTEKYTVSVDTCFHETTRKVSCQFIIQENEFQ